MKELERRKYNKIDSYFPETGSLRRELYAKHMEFFAAGAKYRERTIMAANRVGKTEGAGGYEVTLHAAGVYPKWWVGRRFDKPVNILVSGETGKLVRDSLQKKLLGEPHDSGSGLIPKHLIIDKMPKSGIPDAIDKVLIKHVNGISTLQFMSYDQGREAFQATERDIVWNDEEPPEDIYAESLIRTMTTNGMVISTFTPLKGMTNTVISLQDKAANGTGIIITMTWDDVPHLTDEYKTELMAALPPHQRDARSKGVPALGSGAVFPINEVDFVVQPFDIPRHWKRAYGFDVGWNFTAAAWVAVDVETDTLYIYHDYKREQAEPAIHASAIKQRGEWMNGAIDPASRGRSQHDGSQLLSLYVDQGLHLVPADNAVEAGIFEIYERLSTGRIKVFSTCTKFLEEFRLYRRDEKGRIVKKNDHVMDAARYAVRTGAKIATTEIQEPVKNEFHHRMPSGEGWMG